MILSIIIISHNQKEQLKRCVDSLLRQRMPFDHEIIISDDSSSDGTWELALDYKKNNSFIKAFQCNTDDYNPTTRSERSGWNRCNGLKHATGKYIAHVDGDDFFMPDTDIYNKEVKMLEENPSCSCCMAEIFCLDDGADLSSAVEMHSRKFKSGEILSSEEYIKKYFRESHCFVYRRNPEVDPIKTLGGYYVDSVITAHYLQFGDIVCLNDAGYIYVQYKSSIWASNLQSKDFYVFAHALYIPKLIPKWQFAYLSGTMHLKKIYHAALSALSGHKLSQTNLNWIRRFDLFIYNSFNKHLQFVEQSPLLVLLNNQPLEDIHFAKW